MKMWANCLSDRGNSRHKGPKVGVCLLHCRNSGGQCGWIGVRGTVDEIEEVTRTRSCSVSWATARISKMGPTGEL